jgi:hypothetical protein
MLEITGVVAALMTCCSISVGVSTLLVQRDPSSAMKYWLDYRSAGREWSFMRRMMALLFIALYCGYAMIFMAFFTVMALAFWVTLLIIR